MTLAELLDINPAIQVTSVTRQKDPSTSSFIVMGYIDIDISFGYGNLKMKDKSFSFIKKGKYITEDSIKKCNTIKEIYFLSE